MSDLTMKLVPVKDLVPDPANVRTHDEANLNAIRNSLESFGQRKPLVVARGNGGELVVVAGNGTLEAARSLGWDRIAVAEVPSDWDADKARAFAIADNRTAELADWDQAALSSALFDLDAVGWDASLIGFGQVGTPNESEWEDALGAVGGDRQPVQQMTFTLHDDQVEQVKRALEIAKSMGEFGDTGNPNGNGNALARVAEIFIGAHS